MHCLFLFSLSTRILRFFSAALLSALDSVQPDLHRVVLSQVQDFTPAFVKLHGVPLGAFLQLVKAPVNGGRTLPISGAPCSAMLSVNFRGYFSLSKLLMKVSASVSALGEHHTTNCQLDCSAVVSYLLSPAVLQVFHPFCSLPLQFMFSQFVCKDSM